MSFFDGSRRIVLLAWIPWAWWRFTKVTASYGYWRMEDLIGFAVPAVVIPALVFIAIPWVVQGVRRPSADPAAPFIEKMAVAERWFAELATLDDINRCSLIALTNEAGGMPPETALAGARVVAYDVVRGTPEHRRSAGVLMLAAVRDLEVRPELKAAYTAIVAANRDRFAKKAAK